MSTDARHDDLVHDEYLRAALRHAPDHGLTPPSSVTQTILTAARQAHRPVRHTVSPTPVRAALAGKPRWREVLRFLGSPRWAGGFATGLVAALVVGLWIDNDLTAPIPPPSEKTPASATRRDKATEPGAAISSTAESHAGAAAANALHEAAPTAPPSMPAAVREALAPAPAAPAPAPRGGGEGVDRMTVGRDTAAGQAVQAPAERRGSAESARPAPIAPMRQDRTTAESMHDAPGKAAAAGDQQLRMAAPKAEAATAADGVAQAAASPALTLLRRIRAESTAQAALWTWQPPGATVPRPVDADGQAWLLRLLQAARGRWADVAVPSDPGAATEVRWWRDGQPYARLRIEAGGLRWLEPSGRIRFAPLEAPALEALRSF